MGQGASKPYWMNEDQWAEYKMTYEYKEEVCGVDFGQFESPEDE